MKMRVIVFSAVLLFSCFLGSLNAFDFSSDVIMQSKDHVMRGKIFVSGEKIRMETSEMVVITRLDKNTAWMLMPSQRIYMEQSINRQMVVADKLPDEVDRKLIGQETIDGKQTDKYLVTVKNNEKTEKIHQWMCKDTGIPVKTAAVNNEWSVELQNLKTGSQNQSLFQLPSGYNQLPAGIIQMP